MTDAAQKRQFLACLSDPSRFSLVTTLAGGPRCVTELAGLVGLSQSCTTRHLQALLREGIVSGERQGKRVVYALRAFEPDSHPVLRWACGPSGAWERASGSRAGSQPGASPHADLTGAGMDEALSPAESSAEVGTRRTRRTTVVKRGRPASSEESIEVTDALIVAHDSGWRENDGEVSRARVGEGDDETVSLGSMPQLAGAVRQPADPLPSAPSDFSRVVRDDLDDFLL